MLTIQNLVNALANERVVSVLPKDPTTYTKYRNMSLSDIALDLAWGTVERRSVNWIVRNGKCLDSHFNIQKSTIPKAGLGTFALRKIKKGEMIAPATLVHISDKESLNMFNRTPDPDTVDFVKFDKRPKTEVERPIGKQMLMNYCFGHRDSSVVLCPTITAAAMNHCSNRTRWGGQCTKSGANAGYRWPQDWSPETKEWLQLSYEELKNVSDHLPVLQFVDIFSATFISTGNTLILLLLHTPLFVCYTVDSHRVQEEGLYSKLLRLGTLKLGESADVVLSVSIRAYAPHFIPSIIIFP